MPVSYTHLDVYKRQLVQCAHAAVKSDKSPYYKKKYESLVKRRGKKRAIIAVSYTHLDVYKRQARWRAAACQEIYGIFLEPPRREQVRP